MRRRSRALPGPGQPRNDWDEIPGPDPGHPWCPISTRPWPHPQHGRDWRRPSTNDLARSRRFTREVDAAAVLVNASTRLVDGGEFGMGAEMGISTSRVHARGPVGVTELTTTKFVVQGDGQVRD
jgi:hypothetical protein